MSDTQDAAGRQPEHDAPDAPEQDARNEQDAREPAGPGQDPAGPVRLRLRRAPKYRAFALTGVVIGVVAGLILAYGRAAAGDYSQQTIAGYFAASFGMVGAVIGLGIAVLVDRRH